ncbi:hypothetical protein [Rhodococcus sp. SGAir0479]|uniref:hypothetical protein n=1 Tax=Rhodococcus sp. SGAir0479 TaxID=2567884 RepID=UPI0010CD072B|nr:hypothetical protein [Rhodococcus sp. SGAir0479]QCQ93102.1 hypothetical protein E7742_19005 [Rhodococcus sp. SGAir0479]
MKNETNEARRRVGKRVAVVSGVVGASMALLTPLASAEPAPVPGGGVCDPAVSEGCLTVQVHSGTFSNNGFNLPISDGDMIIAGNTEGVDFLPRDDGHFGVYSKPITVPGGVLGVDLPFGNLFGLANVTATVEGVDVPVFGANLFEFAVSLPVRMKIDNPFLGDNCYIGTAANPVVLELNGSNPDTDPSNIQLHDGTGEWPAGAMVATNVQNTAENFALPGATGCGPFGILNPIVNWRAKVPNSTGTELTTKSTGFLSPSAVGGTDPLDDLGGETGSSGSSGSSGSLGSSGSSGSTGS